MLHNIAFYAPLKSPDHPVPSGDRTMARGLMSALRDIPSAPKVDLVSELRTRDGAGSEIEQRRIIKAAAFECDRILDSQNPGHWQIWMTYHNYYKAPDLVGPRVSKTLGIPYVLVEASRANKRLTGDWADFASRADQASDAADCIFYMTDRDYPSLADGKPEGQSLMRLDPFLNLRDLPPLPSVSPAEKSMVAVGMLRTGDKLESYRVLAEALPFVQTANWTLKIIGDGPAAKDIRTLFAPFGAAVEFLGLLEPRQVAAELACARVFVWPGVNEAFGMVYLEAQAQGLRVIAQDRPGVRDVVGPNSLLVDPGDPAHFAQAIDLALHPTESWPADAARSREYVAKKHLRPSATHLLGDVLTDLVKETP